ncbi:MAG: hypothetical protein C0436_05060 [Alphaproteobacteria bacterium]|nr:hypothetical protein [Alphaproteobacteria bacterium]
MSTSLIWLHEESLRITHPVFEVAPLDTKAVFIWDDVYLTRANYSLKRLVFIYETLCELPLSIYHGDIVAVVQHLAPSTLYIPATNTPHIVATIDMLKQHADVQRVEDEAFTVIKKAADHRRFFQFWNKAEKTAFLHNGGVNG